MTYYSADRVMKERITEDDAFNAEQVILSVMMFERELIKESGLTPEDFGNEMHQLFYRRATELYQSGQPINAVSLKAGLPKAIRNEKITTSEYLARLMVNGAEPSIRNQVEASIHIIKSASMARIISREASIAMELAAEGHPLVTLLDEVEYLQERLKATTSRLAMMQATISPGAAYLQMFNHSAKRDGVVGVPIALPEIAKVLSETVFEAGNLYGLLSSSGEGKSSLTMQLIYHAVISGHPVLFLSYDQSAGQCIRQMISQVHGISLNQQRDPSRRMTQHERDICVKFAMDMDKLPFEIIRCQREGVDQLVTYARRFIRMHANGLTPFIVIDHIGKVKPRDPKLSADRISGEVTVELKATANELGASILILNQRNSEGERRNNPRPIAKDLYGGTGARADYDSIITLYRPEKYKKEMEKVASSTNDWKVINSVFPGDVEGIAEIGAIKVRFGDPNITQTLRFEADFTRYVSMAPAQPQEFDF